MTLQIGDTAPDFEAETTEGKASGFPADEVNACITGLMGSWRFPAPKDKDGEATSASFRIQLQLEQQ